MGGLEQTPPTANANPGFLPALTHFTQSVDAFPKELIRHFSMFKEVEAKMHDPEQMLQQLFDEIAHQPVPTIGQRRAANQPHPVSDSSTTASINGSAFPEGTAHPPLTELLATEPSTLPSNDQAQLERRQLFLRLRMVVASMLTTLDEKMVVLNSAKATKDRGIARMNNSYAHLDSEISEEARCGSLTHWAYADKEEKKKGGASHERHRREVVSANNLAAAAQHVHDVDSIAAKSEARREAMLANKRNRHQHADSDFDDRPAKKTQKRKAVAADSQPSEVRNVGLGISSNGNLPQGKRKKTEKALAAAAAAAAASAAAAAASAAAVASSSTTTTIAPPMERSLSAALKAAGSGGRSGTSPRATPGAEIVAKRKPRAAPEPAQRKHHLPAYSPPLASSPLASSFAISKAIGGGADRPSSARARKNSTANSVTSAVPDSSVARRPSSSNSIPQPTTSNVINELEQAAGIVREEIIVKDAPAPKDPADPPTTFKPTLKHEEHDIQEPERMQIDIPVPTPNNSARTGRTSKTATPIVGTFPEIPMARSRSTRNVNGGNGNSQPSSENNSTTTGTVSKRGHKKNSHSTTTAALPSPAPKHVKEALKSGPPSSASSIALDPEFSDGVDEDGDEPRFCFCNEVSYGAMVGCDNDSCPREWFHLACVNLDKPPSSRTKWFCSDDCKEAYARSSGKGKGGRPGSSRQ